MNKPSYKKSFWCASFLNGYITSNKSKIVDESIFGLFLLIIFPLFLSMDHLFFLETYFTIDVCFASTFFFKVSLKYYFCSRVGWINFIIIKEYRMHYFVTFTSKLSLLFVHVIFEGLIIPHFKTTN